MQRFLLFSFVIFLVASCATTNDVVSDRWIQKRKYTKGYFVASNDKAKTEAETEVEVEVEVAKNSLAESIDLEPREIKKIDTKKSNLPTVLADTAEEATLAEVPADDFVPIESSQAEKIEIQSEAHPVVTSKNRIQDGFDASLSFESELKSADDTEYLLMLILAILLPPLPIFIIFGLETEFWISLILTILLWLPGAIYAIIKVTQYYG